MTFGGKLILAAGAILPIQGISNIYAFQSADAWSTLQMGQMSADITECPLGVIFSYQEPEIQLNGTGWEEWESFSFRTGLPSQLVLCTRLQWHDTSLRVHLSHPGRLWLECLDSRIFSFAPAITVNLQFFPENWASFSFYSRNVYFKRSQYVIEWPPWVC